MRSRIHSTLNSYAQIFYSLHKGLALMILAVTLLHPVLGLTGLVSVVIINELARLLGFNALTIEEGAYGFNALLLGLTLGYEFAWSPTFAVFLVIAMLLLLLVTLSVGGILHKYALPYLSFPFLITYWIISLSASSFTQLAYDESKIYIHNTLAQQAGWWYDLVHSMDDSTLPLLVKSYCKTLAATFFQDSVLAGMVLGGGLLWASRIAFSLSVLGFLGAYGAYLLLGVDTVGLTHYLQGSNFIFLAIGLGCFYLLPNQWSYLFAGVLLMPVLLLVLIFCAKIFGVFHLKIFTLPFSIVSVLVLFALRQRLVSRFLLLVTVQYYNAEKTIYKHFNTLKRFQHAHLARLALPFWGEWMVSQGYNGKITHLGEWGQALDFVILDSEMKTYKLPGTVKEDFYCFNKPVVAPLDGYVYDIVNTVEDNDVADVDTARNWGNTIILNHVNGLFTQISHIKKDSFGVKIGDYVTKGTLLATCGNSGRSPEPHIHFQVQTAPIVGAKTYAYPLACYVEREGEAERLCMFEVPKEGTFIRNIEMTPLLQTAFALLPGKEIVVEPIGDNRHIAIVWQVLTDAYNRSYLYCAASKSYAYFVNDGTMFYFTDFEGNSDSVLFQFYLAAYRVLLGYYEHFPVQDEVPLYNLQHWAWQWLQDFVAPFARFTKAAYEMRFVDIDNPHAPSSITIASSVETKMGNKPLRQMDFEIKIEPAGITELRAGGGRWQLS